MKLRYAGVVLIILLAGCSASHTANPTGVLQGAPSLTSRDLVDPFALRNRNIIQKYTLNYPYSLATSSDKNVWFTESNGIGKITPTGVVTEYPISANKALDSIAAGATGILWFSAYGRDHGITSIYEMRTTGRIVGQFYIGQRRAESTVLAKGPDANMWFTDPEGNSIGKITPKGAITEYQLPTAAANPVDIVAGPDGNLWFPEQTVPFQVGKITPAGVVTEYGSPCSGYSIALGPDGDLYVGSDYTICRVTTSGASTKFPSTLRAVIDIVLGPDRQMWMTGPDGDMVEFNTKTDTFSNVIQVDSSSYPLTDLTVGTDGDVWIADPRANSILVYEEKVTTIGIRLNGELSFTDPNYGFELGYAVGTKSIQTQTISLSMGESVQFKNVDTEPHSAALLGNATANSAPWPASFNGSTTKSPAGTAIGTTGWATGSLNPNKASPIYETGLPGFYMIGCQYHYNTNEMRTVIVVH